MANLKLENNPLEEINMKVFRNASQLEVLDRALNQIKLLPSFLDENIIFFTNLQILNLGHNELEAITARIFIGLPMLQNLSLAYNHVRIIDRAAFEGLDKLYLLELNGNNLLDLPDFVFSPLSSLRYLDLSETGLISTDFSRQMFEAIFSVPFAGSVVVSRRRFNIKSFVNMTLLEELRLNKNHFLTLTDFQQPFISGFRNNIKITLNLNREKFILLELDNLNFLEELELQHVRIDYLRTNTFNDSSLTYLNLQGAEIAKIDSTCFKKATSLRFLDISNINVAQIYVDDDNEQLLSFRNLVKLEMLVSMTEL